MKLYTYEGKTYELITKGITHGTFYVLDENRKRIEKTKGVQRKDYLKVVSKEILKHGQLIEPDNKQKELF